MRFERKDITTVDAPGVIAHGVNCQNRMGAGVAKALYTKWPRVKAAYHAMRQERMVLGEVQMVNVARRGLWVANCFTQDRYGADGAEYADPDAIRDCLRAVAANAALIDVPEVHIPRIGCGLGGLKWEIVERIVADVEDRIPTTFVVCDL